MLKIYFIFIFESFSLAIFLYKLNNCTYSLFIISYIVKASVCESKCFIPGEINKIILSQYYLTKVIIFFNLMILEVANSQKYMQISFGYEKT
jgi:hypothetical protein